MTSIDISYYGTLPYGSFYYGVNPALVHQADFFSTLSASILDYSTVSISWTRPKAPNITQTMLRRKRFNQCADENDGIEVFLGTPGNVTTYVDNTLTGGGFFYYTLFGYDTTIPPLQPGQSAGFSPWRRCGDLTVLVPVAYNYGMTLYNLLPGYNRDNDFLLLDGSNDQVSDSPPLARFLDLLGFQLDQMRTFADSLLMVNDPLNCSGDLLPYICQQLGMPYEIEMGMEQVRQMAANAIHLYRNKGTLPGITEFCSLLTGWPVQTVFMGANKLPNQADSGINTGGTYGWTIPTATTVSGFPAITIPTPNANGNSTLAQATLTPAVTYPQYTSNGVTKTFSTGFKLSVTSAPPANPNNNVFIVYPGIPAQEYLSDADLGQAAFTAWIYPAQAGTRSVTTYLYDESGTLLNSHTQSLTALAANTVVLDTAINISTDVAVPQSLTVIVEILGVANGDIYWLTAMGLYEALAPPALYDLPRDLKIILEPSTANLLGNPLTFGTHSSPYYYGLDGWQWTNPINNAKASVVTSTAISPVFGSAFLQLQPYLFSGISYIIPDIQAGQISTLLIENNYNINPGNCQNIPVTPGVSYTFSVYVAANQANLGFNLGIGFILSVPSTLAANNEYPLYEAFTVTSTFQRYSVTFTAPPYAVSAFGIFNSMDSNMNAGSAFWLNAAMFEQSTVPSSYFDVWTAQVDPDIRLGSNGQSMLFPGSSVRLQRLQTLLPNWIPIGATFTLQLALGAAVPGSAIPSPTAGVTFPFTLPVVIP